MVQYITVPFGPRKEPFLASSTQLPNSISPRISNFDLFSGDGEKVYFSEEDVRGCLEAGIQTEEEFQLLHVFRRDALRFFLAPCVEPGHLGIQFSCIQHTHNVVQPSPHN